MEIITQLVKEQYITKMIYEYKNEFEEYEICLKKYIDNKYDILIIDYKKTQLINQLRDRRNQVTNLRNQQNDIENQFDLMDRTNLMYEKIWKQWLDICRQSRYHSKQSSIIFRRIMDNIQQKKVITKQRIIMLKKYNEFKYSPYPLYLF